MRSRWERFTRSVVALRPVPLTLRPGVERPESEGREAPSQAILAMLVARPPRGAARVEIRDLSRLGLARAVELGSLEADLVAVAEVMVAVAKVMEVAGAKPGAGAKASPHVVVVRAELPLLAVALVRAALTPAVFRRGTGYQVWWLPLCILWFFLCGFDLVAGLIVAREPPRFTAKEWLQKCGNNPEDE
eukprot:6212402-Pleurochrysis_carterae.AAC.1